MPKFTDLHCTIDTHIAPRTREQADAVATELMRIVQEELNTRAGYEAVIPMEEPNTLKSVTLLNASVEMGEKYKRMHIHFNLDVIHEGKVLLKDANRRLCQWFNRVSPWEAPCYASVRLLESSIAKNYNGKAGQYVEPVVARRGSDGEARET